MNELNKIFNDISDEDLKQAVIEIKESDSTGFIKDGGYVRKYAKMSGDITGGFTTTDFYMTTINLLKQAAFRWIL